MDILRVDDVTRFKGSFVAFESESTFCDFHNVMHIGINERNLRIGYIYENRIINQGYRMDFLIHKTKGYQFSAEAMLDNKTIEESNLFFRSLTPEELREIYLILFIKRTGTMNKSTGGMHLISIKRQLLKEKVNLELPNFDDMINDYMPVPSEFNSYL